MSRSTFTSTEFSDEPAYKLWNAVFRGKEEEALALIKSGCPLNFVGQKSRTPLHLAAAVTTNTRIIEALLASDANIEAIDDKGRTPILAAAKQEHWEIVALIARSISSRTEAANAPKDFGAALLLAAYANQTEAVLALLAANSPFLTDKRSKFNATYYAIKNNNPEMLAALLDAGIRDDLISEFDQTPLEYAQENFDAGTRDECISELKNETKSAARIAERRARYPSWKPVEFNLSERTAEFRAELVNIYRLKFSEEKKEVQIAIARDWQKSEINPVTQKFSEDAKEFIFKIFSDRYRERGVRRHHLHEFFTTVTTPTLAELLGEEFAYLGSIDLYKRKLTEKITNFLREFPVSISTKASTLLRSHIAVITDATELAQLDALVAKNAQIEACLNEFRNLLSEETAPRVPEGLIDTGEDVEALRVNRELIEVFNSYFSELSFQLNMPEPRSLTSSWLPKNLEKHLNSIKETRLETLRSLTASLQDSKTLAALNNIDRKILRFKKMEHDLATILSYYEGKFSSNPCRDALVFEALLSIKYGFFCLMHGINCYEDEIKAVLTQCTTRAQIDHHSAAISLGLFGKNSRLATTLSEITGEKPIDRAEALAAAALRSPVEDPTPLDRSSPAKAI